MSTPEIQPGLFKLPEVPKDITDFLKPNGEKNSSIPTGMTRDKIKKLAKNRPPTVPAAIEADDWAKK